MSGKPNGLWTGTEFAPAPPDPALVRMLARDAHGLERAASELREAVNLLRDTDEGRSALTRADGVQAQADRLWAKVDKLLDGSGE